MKTANQPLIHSFVGEEEAAVEILADQTRRGYRDLAILREHDYSK